MNYTPNRNNKELAAEIAGLIYNGRINDEYLGQGMEKLAFHREAANESVPGINADDEQVNRLGIWKETYVEGEKRFVRDPKYIDQFVYWSKNHEIRPKGNKFRVVLLGESVARGFLLDPHYNPSIALQKILDQTDLDTEVIDLARTNCSIHELESLAKQCVQVDPDAIVIFAGNNWIINSQSLITQEELSAIIDSVASGCTTGIKDWTENKLSLLVEKLFSSLENIVTQHQIPVFVINPEFNLKDWRTHEIEKIPLFSTRDRDKWYGLLSKARQAIDNKDYAKAEHICHEMIQMHPQNPTGYEMMAEMMSGKGDLADAAQYYRLAHDATVFQTSHCPGVTSYVQDKIREEASRANCHLIDMTAVFNAYLQGEAPNRKMFLDYCHLSVEGMNITMYHVAAEILLFATGITMPVDEPDVIHFGPTAKAKAFSHFLAAIHNTHWGQGFEIVHYHCSQALSHFDISAEMKHYVFTASSVCPWRLNKHFETLIGDGTISEYLLLAQPEEGLETFDLVLTNAMLKALQENGFDIEAEVNKIRLREHAFNDNKTDLLKTHYWLDYNCTVNSKMKKASPYKEFNPYSKFYIINSDRFDLRIELVHRLPYLCDEMESFEIEFNGKRFYFSYTSDKWNNDVIHIPGELCVKAINTLVIHWPLKNVANHVRDGYSGIDLLHRYMYPVVGEIHSLTMTTESAGEPLEELLSVPDTAHNQ